MGVSHFTQDLLLRRQDACILLRGVHTHGVNGHAVVVRSLLGVHECGWEDIWVFERGTTWHNCWVTWLIRIHIRVH